MEEVDLEAPPEEEVPPDQFVREIFDIAAKRHQRDASKGIYPSDLLYDMIPMTLSGGECVWWMSQSHPIALMLIENELEEISSMASPLGKVIIYSDEMVRECRDCLVELCQKYGLEILDETTNFQVVVDGK